MRKRSVKGKQSFDSGDPSRGIRALRGSHDGNRAKQPSSSSKSHHLVESVNTISSLPYITLTPDGSQMQRRIWSTSAPKHASVVNNR